MSLKNKIKIYRILSESLEDNFSHLTMYKLNIEFPVVLSFIIFQMGKKKGLVNLHREASSHSLIPVQSDPFDGKKKQKI